MTGQPTTYLVIDGENIDATLGSNILGGRKPNPEERPRWDRVRDFTQGEWDQPVKGLFFLNATSGQLPISFVQALLALDYRPIPLAGRPGDKVDMGIQRTLEALQDRPGDVLLVSHDGDFLPQVAGLLDGSRRVALAGFREFVSSRFTELVAQGLQILDLEDDVYCFTDVLPRVRIIAIEDFDPLRYL